MLSLCHLCNKIGSCEVLEEEIGGDKCIGHKSKELDLHLGDEPEDVFQAMAQNTEKQISEQIEI